MERLQHIAAHLSAPAAVGTQPLAGSAKSPDDIVIVSAVRTAICRGRRGGFKDTPQEEMLAAALRGCVERVGVSPDQVDDIVVGNVLPPGGGASVARMAQFYAGFSPKTTVCTVNRQCSSGLQACANIAAAIRAGHINVGIGAGVESMTIHYGAVAMPTQLSSLMDSNKLAADCMVPMGQTSENVAERFNITRAEQDAFAAESHVKAAAAQARGLFKGEIVPVEVDGKAIVEDEGIRADTTPEKLARLRAAFKDDGTTTAGNSSQVSDGAAAVLLMTRKTANLHGLKPLATFHAYTVAGVDPDVMGIGPAFAIPDLLRKTGLSINDIDIFEINEAFASQAVYCVRKLGIDPKKVNPKGGAIALGHPLGCTGARQIATLLPELKRTGGRYGVVSMCIGTGMGAAALIESEQ